MISIKHNILANYASQIYVTLIGILILPLYIKYMGAEAYGLVGFFAMLQVWFNLLDIGLTPTMARETARFRGGAMNALTYRNFVRALEGIFFGIAVIGGAALFGCSEYIANNWLQASVLPVDTLKASIRLIALIISIRWICGLYRGMISGSEKIIWLSGYNSFIATIRFPGSLFILMFIDAAPETFFRFQLCVAAMELAGLVFYSYQLLPSVPERSRISWSWLPLRPSLKFSLTIAFTSSVWVLVTQTDKLILSRILPLAEYGYFTLAVLVATGIIMISGPISIAIMPRMTRLEAEGRHKEIILIYRKSTQFVAIIAASTSITMLFYAEQLLWVWTGDIVLAQQVAPILKLYAVGNGFLAVSAFPYYLQYAKGDLRLHLIGNVIFVILLIPSIIWAANQYGGTGAGYVWMTVNLVVFFCWLPFIHNKFVPGLNRQWYGKDTLMIFLPALLAGYCLHKTVPLVSGRFGVGCELVVIGLIILLSAILFSSEAWAMGGRWIKKADC